MIMSPCQIQWLRIGIRPAHQQRTVLFLSMELWGHFEVYDKNTLELVYQVNYDMVLSDNTPSTTVCSARGP